MVTLTYPGFFPIDGATIKQHLHRFVQELKRFTMRERGNGGVLPREWSVFWFLEFQRRGAPHFHLFTTHDFDKEWIARRWWQIVGTEDERHLRAGTRIERLRSGRDGSISYAVKYTAKSDQKDVPPGFEGVGRFWGVYGLRSCLSAAIVVRPGHPDVVRCRRRLDALKRGINEMVRAGDARVCTRGTTFLGVIVRDRRHQEWVCRMLKLAAIEYAAQRPGTAELYVPIDWTEDEEP